MTKPINPNDAAACFDVNRRRWDELVDIHVKSVTGIYRVAEFRAGADVLSPIESAELGDVAGKDLLHLQCHFGLDTLCLARRGARVMGLDFSANAIAAARALSIETGVPGRFIEGNVYDALQLIDDRFDIVYTTWGVLCWLPDIDAWARTAASLLRPGGMLYLLDGHPIAGVLDEAEGGRLVPTYPYFQGAEPLAFDSDRSYTGDSDRLINARAYEWTHPVGAVVSALIDAGLTIKFLHEHDRLCWRRFSRMVHGPDGMYRLPSDIPSVPLAFSIKAMRK